MREAIYVFVGAGLGALGRYSLSKLWVDFAWSGVPLGILTINVLGSFLMGCFFGFESDSSRSNALNLFLATGVLGGFTTFSAFSLETLKLLQANDFKGAVLLAIGSVLLCVGGCILGFWIIKSLR